ncbi:MAG: hypothetical protein AAB692_05875, partial [Patescibacteria group bacterium]
MACSAAEAAAGGVNVWFDCTKAKREGFACSDAEKNIGGKYQWRTCGQMQCTAAEQQSQSDYPDSPVRYVQGSFYDPIPQDLDDHHLGAGLGQDVNQSDIAGLEFNVEGDSILKFYLTAENHWTNSWEWKGTSKLSGPADEPNWQQSHTVRGRGQGGNCVTEILNNDEYPGSTDPKERACINFGDANDSADRKNCIAARAIFEPAAFPDGKPNPKAGKLKRIDTVLCHNGAALPLTLPTVDITALYRDNCQEVALVGAADAGDNGGKDKVTNLKRMPVAWTDRIWKQADPNPVPGYPLVVPPGASSTNIFTPFGRAAELPSASAFEFSPAGPSNVIQIVNNSSNSSDFQNRGYRFQ